MILVIDVGTSSLRAAAVDRNGQILHSTHVASAPVSPAPGLVEFDATALAAVALEAANATIAAVGPPDAVGVATQRASTVVWNPITGIPIGPGLGWQDLRTIGECLAARAEHGWEIAPNQTATKAAWLLEHHGDAAGLERHRLLIGTVDAWLVWNLTRGEVIATDHTNAGVTGLYDLGCGEWLPDRCEAFGFGVEQLPHLVDTAGSVGMATALDHPAPICAIVGDQQASMVGQGCVTPGIAKITFGTGAMLDMVTGTNRMARAGRGGAGTFDIVGWQHGDERMLGAEAIMLSAGTAIEWLRDDLGLIDTSADSDAVAASCQDTGGVFFVPALLGLGTPHWDYGARGTLVGLTRGTDRAQVVRAVLEGVAHRGADLVAAASTDTTQTVERVRVDGGMSQNPTFVQALADAAGIEVEVSPVVEATTVGAALLAGVGHGWWHGVAETAQTWRPAATIEPHHRLEERLAWHRAVERARHWIPELSALDF